MEPSPFIVQVSEAEMRRERQKARALRQSQWWKRKRASGVCHHCGGKFTPGELTMDHLVPVVRGGKSTKGNVVPSCKPCNTARQHRLPFELTPRPGAG
ncbi:MAG TPA: HNH endonuclease [Candidatus Binatia bacterium]|jgi:5-methylcytosine-specific restriction endonuclease McrA|nr:HNH endonuclease [Candidatus Binatia bacterium]